MKVLCTKTGGCDHSARFPDDCGKAMRCPYFCRTGLAEVIDWRERYEAKCREYDELLEQGLEAVVKVEAVPDEKVAVGPHFRSKPRRSKIVETGAVPSEDTTTAPASDPGASEGLPPAIPINLYPPEPTERQEEIAAEMYERWQAESIEEERG